VALPAEPDLIAPDGSEVRTLLEVRGGGMAHFTFPPGRTSPAIRHRTVDEMWFVTAGRGRMWTGATGEVDLAPDMCIGIPAGTPFQVRCGPEPLVIVAATIPCWPGDGEAEVVGGPWVPSA
jgi:mannose-6-phosphate isomerase-like protein (cupin superfamily)